LFSLDLPLLSRFVPLETLFERRSVPSPSMTTFLMSPPPQARAFFLGNPVTLFTQLLLQGRKNSPFRQVFSSFRAFPSVDSLITSPQPARFPGPEKDVFFSLLDFLRFCRAVETSLFFNAHRPSRKSYFDELPPCPFQPHIPSFGSSKDSPLFFWGVVLGGVGLGGGFFFFCGFFFFFFFPFFFFFLFPRP